MTTDESDSVRAAQVAHEMESAAEYQRPEVRDVMRRWAAQIREIATGFSDQTYHIWSNEHGAWWNPHRLGYTRYIEEAGRYTEAEALEICKQANRGRLEHHPQYCTEAMVPAVQPVPTKDVSGG